MRHISYPVKEGFIQETNILADAKKFASSFNPFHLSLKLGKNHKIARELNGLLISKRPIQYQYIPKLQMILYGPNRL
jgi:hypothetical protein